MAATPHHATLPTAPPPAGHERTIGMAYLPLLAGLIALYVPTLISLFGGVWSRAEQGHGPIILAISCWLLYRNWGSMMTASRDSGPNVWGWPIAVFALLLYVVGRSQDILIFEVGSFIWMLAALLLLTRGAKALKAQWFALFFLLFMIPLPGQIVDLVTMPMKIAVSYVSANLLYDLGFPIGRVGVILQIGQYKLLVADACAGLHTLLTLEALGLLYLNIVRRDSKFRNTGLALLIIPISFTANVIRVSSLVLITYYFGDEAGQGFLHGFAGMVLFLSALCLIIGIDTLLQTLERTNITRKLLGREAKSV